MGKDIILKKVPFGGFDAFEVMDYINVLHKKMNESKACIAQMEKLSLEIDTLEKQLNQKDEEIASLEKKIEQYNSGEIESDLSKRLKEQTDSYIDCYVESAKMLAKNFNLETSGKIETAREKIEVLQNWLVGISSYVTDLYSSLSDIKGDYKNFMEEVETEPEVLIDLTEPTEEYEESSDDEFSTIPTDDMIEEMRLAGERYRQMLAQSKE